MTTQPVKKEINSSPEFEEVISHMVADRLDVAPCDGMYIVTPTSKHGKLVQKAKSQNNETEVLEIHSKHGDFLAIKKSVYKKILSAA
ncbi:MAG: hypothetical protein JWL92_494 [Candidatus Nomurabacteria bacterium]|nr:hypothetical protein [Candidatus Nomurabacteria bacterium]